MVLAGDGRHDSMGHSAKYGTYIIFCCTVGLIIHIVLVQVTKFNARGKQVLFWQVFISQSIYEDSKGGL